MTSIDDTPAWRGVDTRCLAREVWGIYIGLVIDTQEKLLAFVPMLRDATWIALDTEADSLHAYPEKVCLIQISTAAGDRLVDSLAGINLGPLLEALSGHELIMHGADYDVRLLLKHQSFVPSSIFDTMLAARFLGEREFGLGTLVLKHLGVKLEKGPQKANWAMRPLTGRMEQYARNDTHYLKPLEEKLKPELESKGRLAWHAEACARLIQESTQPRMVDMEMIWRIKGSHLLGRPALAVLRELWHWRESEAVQSNRPPYFVLSHEAMVRIAAEASVEHPVKPFLPRHFSERRRAGLNQAIAKGMAVAAGDHPRFPVRTNHRPADAERRRFEQLQKKRDAHAAALGLDPTLIASRGTLADLARDWDKHAAELMKWQRELLA
jgi:ribonuclease D